MSSSGCRRIKSWLGRMSARLSPWKIECGTGLNWMKISVSRSGSLLPVRRKNGTPAQRQLSMWAWMATKVSVSEAWPFSSA